jgi:hypothetical protein
LTAERKLAGSTNAQIKKGAPEGLPLLLYPRFRFRRGETGPPRDKRQPFVWFARGMPPLSSFNRKNHALAGHDLGRTKQFLADCKSGNLQFLKFRSPVFYILWKDDYLRLSVKITDIVVSTSTGSPFSRVGV